MERIGDEVRRSLASTGTPAASSLPAIVAAWPAAVGAAIAAAAWPQRVSRDGTLHVATTSSTWAFELGRLAPEIADRLRDALGDDAPPALRFAPGRVPSPAVETSPGPPRTTVDVSPETRRLAGELTSAIADSALRELVARAAAASLSRGPSDHSF